jgi:hypothetical protein
MPWCRNRQSHTPSAHILNLDADVVTNNDRFTDAPTQNQHNRNASCKRSCALQVNLMPQFSGGQCGEYESKVYPDKETDMTIYLVTEGRHEYNALATFSTPELAEQYIAAHMTTTHGQDTREDYEIMKFELDAEITVRRVYQAEMRFIQDSAPEINTTGNEDGDTQIVPANFEWCRTCYADYAIRLGGGPWCRAQALTPERAIELVAQAYERWVQDGRPIKEPALSS